MTVPASASSEKLIQDYLTRLVQASRLLPKGRRGAFVAQTKALVERETAQAGLDDPGRVAEVLASLGEPEDLVQQERMQIDRAWAQRRAPDPDSAAAAAAAVTAHRGHRPLTPRWRPLSGSRPRSRAITPHASTSHTTTPGRPAIPGQAKGTGPAPWPGRLDDMLSSGSNGEGNGPAPGRPETPLDHAARLARAHKLESVAIVLLGLGGLILPFPFWLVGAVTAMFSRRWDLRDKATALLGPLLVVLAGSVLSALFIGGKDNVVMIYTHAIGASFGALIRVGCVLSAAYLAWRVYQGPRPKVPPWKRGR
jgi:hypothetical protein